MSVFVDFQGFEQPNGVYVIKEFAIQPISQLDFAIVEVFQPPCPKNHLSEQYQSSVNDFEKNLHGIPWTSGDIEYNMMENIIQERLQNHYEYIFVRNEEKKNWLSAAVKNKSLAIISLDEIGCPSDGILQKEPVIKHSYVHPLCKTYKCAYENAQRYKTWFLKEFSPRPNLRKSIVLFCGVERLSDMTSKDIAKLPIVALTKLAAAEIDDNWDKLSEEQRSNQIVAGWRRCKEHPLNQDFEDVTEFFCFSYVNSCIKCRPQQRI